VEGPQPGEGEPQIEWLEAGSCRQSPGVLWMRLPIVVARLESGNEVWGGKSRVLMT